MQPYRLMTLDAIKALPIADLALESAHLYLWTTAKLNARGVALDVVRAWGFEWVGEIVWRKNNFGLGRFPRPQHEIVTVARRGKLPFRLNNFGSVQTWRQDYSANGGKRHSVKPEAFIDMVETNSPAPYLELFARRQRLGWATWGDEALHHVELTQEARG